MWWWWSGEAVPLGGGREEVERYVCAASDAGERESMMMGCVFGGGWQWRCRRPGQLGAGASGWAGCKFRFGCWRGTGSG